MTTKTRKPTIRISPIRRGDPIRAGYLNQLAQGANIALSGLDPPRSLRVRSTDDQLNELQQGSSSGSERIFTEISRATTTVTVPEDSEVELIDQISFQAGDEILTLVLDWS